MANESNELAEATEPLRVRRDWRTGQPMVEHGEAFWREHEQRRVAQGLSVPQYCAANDLALSTFRHRVYGTKRGSAKPKTATLGATQAPAFVAVSSPQPTAGEALEVAFEGMTLRLRGEAAERVLAVVMTRLA